MDKVELAGELEPEGFERPDLSKMHRTELEAEVVHLAKLVERFRQGITNIVREFEDEGDRVYLGSTNDAEDLRALDELLSDAGNELHIHWMHGKDLYADLRTLRTDTASLQARIAVLEGALGRVEEETRYVPNEYAKAANRIARTALQEPAR